MTTGGLDGDTLNETTGIDSTTENVVYGLKNGIKTEYGATGLVTATFVQQN